MDLNDVMNMKLSMCTILYMHKQLVFLRGVLATPNGWVVCVAHLQEWSAHSVDLEARQENMMYGYGVRGGVDLGTN